MISLLCWECGYSTRPGTAALVDAYLHQEKTKKKPDEGGHDSWRVME